MHPPCPWSSGAKQSQNDGEERREPQNASLGTVGLQRLDLYFAGAVGAFFLLMQTQSPTASSKTKTAAPPAAPPMMAPRGSVDSSHCEQPSFRTKNELYSAPSGWSCEHPSAQVDEQV